MAELSYSSIGWTVARLARQVEVALVPLDLSPAQYRMLVQIARGTDASSSLAQKLAVSAPSVTSVVDGLVQRGAVERAHSVEDRRRIALALTGDGRFLLDSAESALRDRLQSIADELEEDDLVSGAIAALSLWGEALDRARARRHGERAATAAPHVSTAGPQVGTAGPHVSSAGPHVSSATQHVSTAGPHVSTAGPQP
ncbi:MAG TPA: MarR family transcriptional regulator [Acidimicrobiales bacterium]|nr:MarR family transcriptional regulator [Acidimicrobiales bacterium]